MCITRRCRFGASLWILGTTCRRSFPRVPVGGFTKHRACPCPRQGSTWSACFHAFISLLCIVWLESSVCLCLILWNSSLARDGEVYLASSSSRFTIRKRPAAGPSLLEACIVPRRRRKCHTDAVVSPCEEPLCQQTCTLRRRRSPPTLGITRLRSSRPSRPSLVDLVYRAQDR